MTKGIGPLLILGGGLALLMATKKKKDEKDEVEGAPEVPDLDDEGLTDLERCDRFLSEIYVEPSTEDEMPIIEVAMTEEIIPRLRKYSKNVIKEKGVVDTEEYPKYMARLALEEIIPVCTWEITEQGELISPDDERARKIYNSLIDFSRQIAIEENAAVGIAPAGFVSEEKELPEARFEPKE